MYNMMTERVRQTLWSQGYAFFKVEKDGKIEMLACAVLDRANEKIMMGAGKTPAQALRNALEMLEDKPFSLTPETLMNLPSLDEVPNILEDHPQ